MKKAGYRLSYQLLNAYDYGVPQTRQRVFFVGIRKDVAYNFHFPAPLNTKIHLKETIGDLEGKAIPIRKGSEVMDLHSFFRERGYVYADYPFSSFYMSSNRVRARDEPSYTIVASAKNLPLHPQAPKMSMLARKKHAFVEGKEHLYRRLSIRECARIQTFPDDFIFHYSNLEHAYKMVGNAVPVKLAFHVGKELLGITKS